MQTTQTTELGAEQTRLQESRDGKAPWKKWGPYLSERQWGTVREDYSDNGGHGPGARNGAATGD
jgi:hypothetical protein